VAAMDSTEALAPVRDPSTTPVPHRRQRRPRHDGRLYVGAGRERRGRVARHAGCDSVDAPGRRGYIDKVSTEVGLRGYAGVAVNATNT